MSASSGNLAWCATTPAHWLIDFPSRCGRTSLAVSNTIFSEFYLLNLADWIPSSWGAHNECPGTLRVGWSGHLHGSNRKQQWCRGGPFYAWVARTHCLAFFFALWLAAMPWGDTIWGKVSVARIWADCTQQCRKCWGLSQKGSVSIRMDARWTLG